MDKSFIVSGKFLSIGLSISSKVSIPLKWLSSMSSSCLVVISKLKVAESISWNILDITDSATSLDGIAKNIGSSCFSLWENCNTICVKGETNSLRFLNGCLLSDSLLSDSLLSDSLFSDSLLSDSLFTNGSTTGTTSSSTISFDNSLLRSSLLSYNLLSSSLLSYSRLSDSTSFSDCLGGGSLSCLSGGCLSCLSGCGRF